MRGENSTSIVTSPSTHSTRRRSWRNGISLFRFSSSLITGIRVRDLKRGWFVYRWKAQRDQVDGFIETQKRKALDRLKQRLEYENKHEFYSCDTQTCKKLTFEEAMEAFFKCPTCDRNLNLIDNQEFKQALEWKIGQMEKEALVT